MTLDLALGQTVLQVNSTQSCHSFTQTFSAECCDQVAVKSSGPAAYEQELYIGKYQRLSEGYNGHPAYSKNITRPLFIYFFTGKKENQWAIGPVLGQRQAAMKNSGSGACVDSPGDEWIYATSEDNWRDNDHTLTVDCDQAHDAIIDDLVNLELNRTRLTIGLTTVQRNSKHNANEKMKHKEMDIAADSRDILTTNMIKKGKNKGIIANSAENYRKKIKENKKDKKVKFSKKIDIEKKAKSSVSSKISTSDASNINQNQTISEANANANYSTEESEEASNVPTLLRKISRPSIITEEPPSPLTRCYSCGSLFSSDSSDCAQFDKTAEDQQMTCKAGDACLLYAWKVSEKETGGFLIMQMLS